MSTIFNYQYCVADGSGRKAAKGRKGSVRNPFSSIVKLGLRGRAKKRTPVDIDKVNFVSE